MYNPDHILDSYIENQVEVVIDLIDVSFTGVIKDYNPRFMVLKGKDCDDLFVINMEKIYVIVPSAALEKGE